MSLAQTVLAAIKQEQVIRGVKRRDAMKLFAREAGLSPGTIENLVRGRLRDVARIERQVNAYLASRANREIDRLQHQLSIYSEVAGGERGSDLGRVQALLDQAKALMKGVNRGKA